MPDAPSPRDARPSPAARGRAWPHIRALLISVHVLAVILGALPAPSGGMKRGAWRDPTVQDEFAAWRGRLPDRPPPSTAPASYSSLPMRNRRRTFLY